jgi:Mrp family chromosome partitioning ATPase/capsular polysaccharide biosynthesis protein
VNGKDATHTGDLAAVRALRSRVWVVLACLVIVPTAAVVVSLAKDREYKATASLLFRQPKIDEVVAAGSLFAETSDPNRFAVTNLELIKLDAVASRAAQRLGLNEREVSKSIKISPKGQSDVAGVTATASSPRDAARLANTYAAAYIAMRERSDHSLIRTNSGLLQREFDQLPPQDKAGEAGRIILDRINRLKLLDGVKLGGIQLVDAARPPSSPAAPKPLRSSLIGLAVGALLGLGLALLLERRDRRLKLPEDITAAFGRPVLARIPASDSLSPTSSNRLPIDDSEAEPLKVLRTKLRHSGPGEDASSVLVASAVRGEGRTTIAWNLAAISADLELSVLLIEADLHHPILAEALALPGDRGLAQVLAGEASLDELVQPVDAVLAATRADARRSVDVLVAGPVVGSSLDLVDSDRMRDLLASAHEHYDLVVIDSPAVSEAEDFLPLAKMVRAVILVSRPGAATREAAESLSEQLREMGVKPVGVVLNALGAPDGRSPSERTSDLAARS